MTLLVSQQRTMLSRPALRHRMLLLRILKTSANRLSALVMRLTGLAKSIPQTLSIINGHSGASCSSLRKASLIRQRAISGGAQSTRPCLQTSRSKTVIAGDMECEVRFCAFHGKPTLACKGDCKQWDASTEIRDMMRDLGLWTAPFKKGGCADVPSIDEKGEEGHE